MCWRWLAMLFGVREGSGEMPYMDEQGGGYVRPPTPAEVKPAAAPVVTNVVGEDHTVLPADEVVVYHGNRNGNVYLPPATASFRKLSIVHAGTGGKLVVDAVLGYFINRRQKQTLHRGSSMTIIDNETNNWSIL